jgi:hypothetical protein
MTQFILSWNHILMILIFGTLFGIVLALPSAKKTTSLRIRWHFGRVILFSYYSNLNVLKYDKRHIE